MVNSSATTAGDAAAVPIDNLHMFFYLLLRDHLPAGVVEELVWKIETASGKKIHFSNMLLARYAETLAARIQQHQSAPATL